MKKIDIGQDANVLIRWNSSNSITTEEEEKAIISKMAAKYGIPAKHIKIEKCFAKKDSETTLAGDVVQSMYDPKFQQEVMKQYIANNNIKDVDFSEIEKIDSQINSLIDYSVYEKGKRYTIKWVRWGNFLSYGPDNFFDFTTLKGLILLNGKPANKSGKSTFAYDLLHFLLFGKTNTNKAKTLGELFNNYLPNETTVKVEGCITIDGEDYIIRRTLTRPAAGKKSKTVTNKVEYFSVLEDGSENLLPDTNQQGATTTKTNQIIKEALGNENDFDLIISANAKDLDSLISLTETEKGRLLSRWIGLSVIEDKDAKAREKWNKELSIGRYSDMYNRSQLSTDIENLTNTKKELGELIEKNNSDINECDKKIDGFRNTKDILLSSKQQIDNSLINIDVTTLEASMQNIVDTANRRKAELQIAQEEIGKIGDVEYSEVDYKTMKRENEELISKMAELRYAIETLKKNNASLANAEYCPTCHRKLDGVDNSEQIKKNEQDIVTYTNNGKAMKARSNELNTLMTSIEEKRLLSNKKSQLEIKIATINNEITSLRSTYREKNNTLKEIQRNKEAIKKNGEIDAQVNVIMTNIRTEENIKRERTSERDSNQRELARVIENISTKKSYIVKIDEEQKVEKYWKLYLQMVGKDGICKMVLRNTLPIINNELDRLLGDVTDFKVEVTMNDKNDIDFLLIRDDIKTRLSAASGLEKTQAALALRVVLGKLSKLSRPPFILLDEVLGTVAKENYGDMKKLYDKIVAEYEFVLHICHIDLDWYDKTITVTKTNNISSIEC